MLTTLQFRALSDQLYRTEKYHAQVRHAVAVQLAAHHERYEGFVDAPSFADYLADIQKPHTWGDHLTLQAAADAVRFMILIIMI